MSHSETDTPYGAFQAECDQNAKSAANDAALQRATKDWFVHASRHKYSYNFTWMGRPIIQYPQDIVAIQELIWQVKPDLIVETGIAHGGSLILSASMLALIDYTEAVRLAGSVDPRCGTRKVLGIDVDIRSHNRSAIEAHPMAHRIDMIEGSSVAPEVIAQVHEYAIDFSRILICLDSNHTHDHVLAELEAYAPLTSRGSYCVVFDTVIQDMPADSFPDRPWNRGNNPKTAVCEYLRRIETEGRKGTDGESLKFEIDKKIENKLLVTVAPDGYLKRV